MTFAHPGWFLLVLLVPLLTTVAIVISRQSRKQWHAFVAERLRPLLVKRHRAWPLWLSFAFLLVACILMLGALARPQADAGTRTEVTRGRNLMFVLDLSRSMRVTDVKPDRLAQAKAAIYEILESRPTDRAGLVGFAGTPYLFVPMTVDHGAVRETVAQLDETWVPTGGSNLTAALRLAIDTLKKTGLKQNAVVVLSDGEEHRPELAKVIEDAEQAGVYLFTIGVGTEEGDFVPAADSVDGRFRDNHGNPVLSRLNSDELRKLASETHGRFALAGSGADIPGLVRDGMAGLEEFQVQGRQRKVFVEFYQWLLLPAVLCLMAAIFAGTRWRGIAPAVVSAAVVAASPSVQAASVETNARQNLSEAFSAYRQNDFRTARSAYSGALLSSDPAVEANAHAGLGNALFQLGWQSLCDDGEAYGADPESPPDLDSFDKLVLARLAKWKASTPPEAGESDGYSRFESLIVNWTDSIRHFDSTLAHDANNPDVRHNRALVVRYLERLQELLKDQSEQAQQQLPQQGQPKPKQGEPQQGKPDQQPGEGDSGEEPQKGPKGEQKPEEGPQGDREENQPGDQGEKPEDHKGDHPDEKDQESGEKPGETAEERARRILSEKADTQKGPLVPGGMEFRRPEKDW